VGRQHHNSIKPQHPTTRHIISIILHCNLTIMRSHSTTQHSPSRILCSITRDHNTTHHEVTMQLIEEQNEPEEVSDATEDLSHVTIARNQEIMNGSVHCHQQLVCTVAHQTMIRRTVRHYLEKSKKKGTKITRMISGFQPK
jgi:hypothetical protein